MALSGARGTTGELKVVKENSPVEAKNLKKKCGQTTTELARRHPKDCGGKLDDNCQKQAYMERDGRGLHPGVDGVRLKKKNQSL